ncbi:MAG: hypothetical protein IKN72_07630 [Clostridia bacterium]|nr:hypothetical protein [Clostridia bacterium]
MYCQQCGAKNDRHATICQQCGSYFSPKARNRNWKNICIVLLSISVVVSSFFAYRISSNLRKSDKLPSNETNAPLSTGATSTDNTTTESTTTSSPITETSFSAEEYKAQCKYIPYLELARNPSSYEGQNVYFRGKIQQVVNEDVLFRAYLVYTDYENFDDTILIACKTNADEERLLEDDIIEFWGEYTGLYSYVSVLNQKITVPSVACYFIERVK